MVQDRRSALEKAQAEGRVQDYDGANEQKAANIAQLLEENNFENILIKKDMQGKDRMIKAMMKL